jgi:hypothetical protein
MKEIKASALHRKKLDGSSVVVLIKGSALHSFLRFISIINSSRVSTPSATATAR